MARNIDTFQTIKTEGAMLPGDLLSRVVASEHEGMTPQDYDLPAGDKLNEAISQSWSRLRRYWVDFKDEKANLPEDQPGTDLTNQKWLLPLFRELGYGKLITSPSPIIDDKTYPITRFWDHVPIHFVGCNVSLDKRSPGVKGASTGTPHGLVQEFLNRSESYLWAFVSNGLRLRVLRDNIALSRQAYVEFDLESIFEGEIYSDFGLFWLLCHVTRVEVPQDGNPEDCWLEKWSKTAAEEGTRIREDLSKGVKKAIEALGRGFISHPYNDHLRQSLAQGQLSTQDFYRQILRVVYRLLFLFVTEDRELFHPHLGENSYAQAREAFAEACHTYDTYYSTRHLRDMAQRIKGSRHGDLWHALSMIFDALQGRAETQAIREALALPALGSFLWSANTTGAINGPGVRGVGHPVQLANEDLLEAMLNLAYIEKDRTLRIVNYKNMGTEELGSVYESLLELQPEIHAQARRFELKTVTGSERKTTGSYYTPDCLVQCLLDSALEPVIKDRLANKSGNDEQEKALLDIKVCDPACGSGHFLISAAHRLARHLARIRAVAADEAEPTPIVYQHALRDVIGRCVFGVDINPMAVELCKINLWLESIDPGKPLSFLDHHIKCGNSLLGTNPALMARGIPEEAFEPIEGDIKQICTSYKKQNKEERIKGQKFMLFDDGKEYPWDKLGSLSTAYNQIEEFNDDTIISQEEKQKRYEELVKSSSYEFGHQLADSWCAAFVIEKSKKFSYVITENIFREIERKPFELAPWLKEEIKRLSRQYQFFHWHLEFPSIFKVPGQKEQPENEQTGLSGGYDCVLGNPPWERIKLQEKEWFASISADIADAPNAAERRALIAELQRTNPQVYDEFVQAKRAAEGQSHFARNSSLFPMSARGDINTYALFAELKCNVVAAEGKVGCIVPTGIATDEPSKVFFNYILDSNILVSLYDFENAKGLFPDVKRTTKFCLLTLNGSRQHHDLEVDFIFFAHEVEDLHDSNRKFNLRAEDIKTINPNTGTCPIFRDRRDAQVTRFIHSKYNILMREDSTNHNPWSVCLTTLFHMSNDSDKFRTFNSLSNEDLVLIGNELHSKDVTYVPLYEQNLINYYDHRFASFISAGQTISDEKSEYLSFEMHNDPSCLSVPRYWLPKQVLQDVWKAKNIQANWLIGFRQSARTVDSRTGIFCILPQVAAGNSIQIAYLSTKTRILACSKISEWNSFICDYLLRQSLGGNNINFFLVKQIATVGPEVFSVYCSWCKRQKLVNWIADRVIELSYTAWDLESFAKDCGYGGPPFVWDEERRFEIAAEIDAVYFHLYLGTEEDWKKNGTKELSAYFPTPRHAVEYIMETFPIVKRKDEKEYGSYRTKELILDIYDKMAEAMANGTEYQTILDPPPGPPCDAEGNFIPTDKWDMNNWPVHIHRPKENMNHGD